MRLNNRVYPLYVKSNLFAQLIVLFHGGKEKGMDNGEILVSFPDSASFKSALEFLDAYALPYSLPF